MKFLKLIGLIILFFSSLTVNAELRDPTKPMEFSLQDSPSGEPWVLNAVVFSPYRKIAVINGQLTKIGSVIAGARVIGIKKKSVLLDNAGDKIILFLFDRSVRKISNYPSAH